MEVFLLIVAVLIALIIFGKLKGDLDIGKLDVAGLKREIWVTQNWINNYHKGGCPPKYHEKFQYKLLRLEQANTQLGKLTSINTTKSDNAGCIKPEDIEQVASPIMAEQEIADLLSNAERAYSTGDYAGAVKLYRLAAERGVANAQNNLGAIYDNGDIVPQDRKEAAKWWKLAAEQGYSAAQESLGRMYYRGEGVLQDHKEAAKWWGLAAAQGIVSAQFALGVMYDKGEGVPQDYKEAIRLLNLAAEQGDANAQSVLGAMYYIGQTVPQDLVLAHMWVSIAAATTNSEKQKIDLIETRGVVAQKMTAEQISEAQERARKFSEK